MEPRPEPPSEPAALALATVPIVPVEKMLAVREQLKQFVRQVMVEGQDYGYLPGTPPREIEEGRVKPMLFKAGAEKLTNLFALTPEFKWGEHRLDLDGGSVYCQALCSLRSRASGMLVVVDAVGSCNSAEAKFAWRWVWPREVDDMRLDKAALRRRSVQTRQGESHQYRVRNTEIGDLVNTIEKQAQKRALVAATLMASRVSDLFHQDLEDMAPEAREAVLEVEAVEVAAEAPAARAPKGRRRAGPASPGPPGRVPEAPAPVAAAPAPKLAEDSELKLQPGPLWTAVVQNASAIGLVIPDEAGAPASIAVDKRIASDVGCGLGTGMWPLGKLTVRQAQGLAAWCLQKGRDREGAGR